MNSRPVIRRPCSRRGQTRLESVLALVWFAIAAAGAWLLYARPIAATTRAMWEFFFGPAQ